MKKDRVFFTWILTQISQEIIDAGDQPIFDYIKRSNEEQKRLYKQKLSDCDGYKKISQHQLGKACDIYFIKNNKILWNKFLYEKWHTRWQELGGSPAIPGDLCHFQVK